MTKFTQVLSVTKISSSGYFVVIQLHKMPVLHALVLLSFTLVIIDMLIGDYGTLVHVNS